MARLIFGLAALTCFVICVHGDAAYGYGHYHYAKTTCADHYKPGVKNGFYKVYSTKHYGAIKVYCDFETEPGNAYTLVMSSTSANRGSNFLMPTGAGVGPDPFVGLSLTKVATTHAAFNLQRDGVNGNAPNNDSYRLPQADIEKISRSSGVWRYTCGEHPVGANELTHELFFTNYLRVALTEVNPTAYTMAAADFLCDKKAEYISGGDPNPAGRSCADCLVNFEQEPDQTLRPSTVVTNCPGSANWAPADDIVTTCEYLQFWFGKSV